MSVEVKRLDNETHAAVWVEEFLKVAPDADEGLMLAWFANAIETGRYAGVAEQRNNIDAAIWKTVDACEEDARAMRLAAQHLSEQLDRLQHGYRPR